MDDDTTVEVPCVTCPLQQEELSILQSLFNNDPHDDIDNDMGIALYICTRIFVHSCVD